MKRFLSLALIACICLCVCSSLISCNDSTTEEPTEATFASPDTEAPDETEDPAALKARFKEALSFKDVENVTLKLYSEYKEDLLEDSGSTILYFDGAKTKSVSVNEYSSNTFYYEKTGTEFHVYLEGENGWERIIASADAPGSQYTILADYVSEFEYVSYEDYTYDGEVFACTEKSDASTETITIKIDGTKLVYIEMYIKNSDYEYTRRYEFSDYGETKVELPTDYVEAGGNNG